MTATTYTARTVAGLVSKRVGRKVTDKAVRSWVREHVTRFQDDRYTAHAYTTAERDRIVSGMVARSNPRATGTNGRARSASQGRSGTATTPRKPRKATPSTPSTPESAS